MKILSNFKKKIKNNSENYIYLQVTTPLRRDVDIREAIKIFNNRKHNCLISVSDTFVNPLWCNPIIKNSMYNFIDKKISTTQSQKLPKKYQINGCIFIIRKKCVNNAKSFYQIKNSVPFYMNKNSPLTLMVKMI